MFSTLADFKLQVNFKLAIEAARITNTSNRGKVWGIYKGRYFLAKVIGKSLFKPIGNSVIVQWCKDSLISEINCTEIKQCQKNHLFANKPHRNKTMSKMV
jgi:hypothetical protein